MRSIVRSEGHGDTDRLNGNDGENTTIDGDGPNTQGVDFRDNIL